MGCAVNPLTMGSNLQKGKPRGLVITAVDEAAKRASQEPKYSAGRHRCNCEPADQLIRNTALSGGHRCANQVWQQQAHYSTDSEEPASPLPGDEPQTDGGGNDRPRPPNLALMQLCNRNARRLRW